MQGGEATPSRQQSSQVLNLMYQDANKMFYEIDGQINNLYSMHARASASLNASNSTAVREMSDSDVELIRERTALLGDKLNEMDDTFAQAVTGGSLPPEKQTYWRKRIESLRLNVVRLPQNLARAQRNYNR